MRGLEDVEVVGLGQACVDYLGRIAQFPKEDDKVELMDLHIQCGGPASTALVTLSRFGIRTSFLGSISDDPFGMEIIKALENEKVDFTFLKVTPGYLSQFAFIAINKEDGRRTIFWTRGNVPPLREVDVDLGHFPNARILHIDGLMIEASKEASRQARGRGIEVIMDAGTMREGSKELAGLVDVLIASEKFALPLVGKGAAPEDAIKALRALGPERIIITLGPLGSVGCEGHRILRQEAFSVKAVDTTGAGDVYHGAFIYGLLRGWHMSRCMLFASAASALKCREIGARKGIPTLDDVRQLLEKL